MAVNFTGSLAISGSLVVSGSILASGSITISGSIASASYAEFLGGLPSSSFASASVFNIVSSSYASASGSLSTRVTKIEGNYATTGSNAFNGSQNITGSLTVSQAVIAQTLNVQQVTSSIVYSCGSNVFGCSTSDVQQMTGSVTITGSLNTVGTICSTSNTCFGGSSVVTGCLGVGIASTTSVGGNTIMLYDASTPRIRLANTTTGTTSTDGGELSLFACDFNIENREASGAMNLYVNGALRQKIFNTGIACFACQVCAPQGIFINGAASLQAQFGQNSDATGTQTSAIDIISRNAANTAGFTFRIQNCATTCTTHLVYSDNTVMAFRCSGNVGIGTTTPTALLHNSRACNSETNIYIENTCTGTGAGSSLYLVENSSTFTPAYGQLTHFNSGYSTNGLLVANRTWLSNSGGELLLGTRGAHDVILHTGGFAAGCERMRITSGGNVGINTSGPTATSTPHFFIGTNMSMFNGASDDSYIGSNFYYNSAWYYRTANAASQIQQNGGDFYFKSSTVVGTANGALTWCERMRLTCDGILAIKTTSTSTEANLFLGAQGTVEGGQLVLQKGTSCSCATHLDNYQNTFRIMSGTDTASNTVHFLVDYIQSMVGIGRTVPFTTFGDSTGITQYGAGTIYASAAGNEALGLARRTSDGAVALFRRDTTTVGSICVTTTATSFNTSSDYRLKIDLRTFNAGCLISKIKPYDFQWKINCDRMYGFIAHELAEVLPYAVSGEKDGQEMQSLDYSKLTPILVKAIQEQQCQICSQSTIIHQLKTCLGMA